MKTVATLKDRLVCLLAVALIGGHTLLAPNSVIAQELPIGLATVKRGHFDMLRFRPSQIDFVAQRLLSKSGKIQGLLTDKPTVAAARFIGVNILGDETLDNIQDDLRTALVNSNQVKVLERARLHEVLKLLKIEMGDLFDSERAKQLGQMKIARYVLMGSVSDRDEFAGINTALIDTVSGNSLSPMLVNSRLFREATNRFGKNYALHRSS